MKSIGLLVDLICEAYDNPIFKAHTVKLYSGVEVEETHCNLAVNYVVKNFGFKGLMDPKTLEPYTANKMIEILSTSKCWREVENYTFIQQWVNDGGLAVAGLKGIQHGHVCIIRPGRMTESGKWGMTIPKCCNIGSKQFTSISNGVNYAFDEKPQIWIYENGQQ